MAMITIEISDLNTEESTENMHISIKSDPPLKQWDEDHLSEAQMAAVLMLDALKQHINFKF